MKNLAATSIVLLVLALGYGAIFFSQRADNLQQQISDTKEQLDSVGSSNPIESPVALFETTLANSITSSATTMTLSSALTKDGTTLASSTYGFIIDEGTASEEFVSADCTATACTNMTRGISVVTGTTTVSALQKSHRRGASVKITDGPILIYIARILNGIGTFPNTLRLNSGMTLGALATYNSALSFTPASNQLASVLYAEQYANNVIAGGAPTSTQIVGGKVILATKLQAASSTDLGVLAPLVLQAKDASSTPGFATTTIPVTMSNGKLESGWINQTQAYIWSALHIFTNLFVTGSSTIACSSSSKCNINGVPTVFPTALGASSTVLTTNGSGGLFYNSIGWRSSLSSTFSSSATATTTAATIVIPANTISLNAPMTVDAQWSTSASNYCNFTVQLGNGSASTTIGYGISDGPLASTHGMIFASSTSAVSTTFDTTAYNANVAQRIAGTGQSTMKLLLGAFANVTLSSQLYLSFSTAAESGAVCGFSGAIAQTLPSF